MASKSQVAMYYDHNGGLCLKVGEQDGVIRFIPVILKQPLAIQETSLQSFRVRYVAQKGYCPIKAAQIFINYADILGASDEIHKILKNAL